MIYSFIKTFKKKNIRNKKISSTYWFLMPKKDLTKIKKYDEINKLKGQLIFN